MKIGLVVEGGGMKCAYSAAVLDRFLDDAVAFDYVIGVSAGSANVASFLAGQRDRNRRFYTDHISDPDYFGLNCFFKTGNLFNLHHIYADISNSYGKDPLDYEKICDNPTEYEVVATNAKTAKAEFFDGHKMPKDDYRLIMASCALPAACKPVKLDNGCRYYDGGVSDSIPVDRAIEKGCDKLVVITSKPRDFVKMPEGNRALYSLLCMKYPKIVKALNNRHIMYKSNQDMMFELEKEGKAFLYCPSKNLPMSTYAMDKDANQKLYNLGIRDYNDTRKSFLKFMKRDAKEAI